MRSRPLWTAFAALLLLDAVGIALGHVLRARRRHRRRGGAAVEAA